MGLERRGNRLYYYTSERVGNRVVKSYGGSGYAARLYEDFYRTWREERHWEISGRKIERQRIQIKLARLRRWWAWLNRKVAKELTAAGWHQHKREWRKRRGPNMNAIANSDISWNSTELRAKGGGMKSDVLAKAQAGDVSVMPEVNQYLQNPFALDFMGDGGRLILDKWINVFAGDDLLTKEAFKRRASLLRSQLAGPNPSALELILAERVVLAWIFESWAEYQYIGLMTEGSLAWQKFRLQRVELAKRQLLSAAKTLAKVRRAKLPDVLAMVVTQSKGHNLQDANPTDY